jgi:hypothetical protein
MMRRVLAATIAAAMACALTACAGGGGGGGGGSPGGGGGVIVPPAAYNGVTGGNFTSWSAITAPSTVTAVGVAREMTYSGSNSTGVTTLGAPSAVLNAAFSQTFNANGSYASFSVGHQNRTITFSAAGGDGITFGTLGGIDVIVTTDANDTKFGLAIDPIDRGWNYQSFGMWGTEAVTGTTFNGVLGASSVGKTTNGDQIPTTGSATFNGVIAGVYVTQGGDADTLGGPLTVSVNFAGRTASLLSGDLLSLPFGISYPGTAVTGILTYSSQSNALTGTLSTARLTGGANGQFYGPGAEEIGGVFILAPSSGSSVERLVGGFGAKR